MNRPVECGCGIGRRWATGCDTCGGSYCRDCADRHANGACLIGPCQSCGWDEPAKPKCEACGAETCEACVAYHLGRECQEAA